MPRPRSTGRRRQPRQERSRALVDAILDATADTLRVHGLEATTTVRIAERAGVSVGSFYQYFPNKPALYEALAARFFARIDQAAGALRPHLTGVPLRDAVGIAIRGVIAVAFLDPVLDRILHQVSISRTGLSAVAAFEARQEARIAEFLTLRRAELPDPSLDPDLAARVVMRAVGGIVASTLAREPEQARHARFAEEVLHLVERYLGYRDAAPPSS